MLAYTQRLLSSSRYCRSKFANLVLYSTSAPPTTATSFSVPGLIRPARGDDYNRVMDINHNVHDERDYLPHLFHNFVREPRVHCYVYEMHDRVIGFEAAQVVDGGKTLVTRGTRVQAEYQGHGVIQSLRKHILTQLTTDHPVNCVSMTTTNTTELGMKTKKEICQRDVHVFRYDATLTDIPDKDDFSTQPVHSLTTGQLFDTFQEPRLRSYLFPQDRLVINAVPFRLMEENKEDIKLENPFIVASEQVTKQKATSMSGILSISTCFPGQAGFCCDLELHGTSSNFLELCTHVGRHVRHIQHLGTHGHIMMPHSRSISADVLLCVMARYGLAPMALSFNTQYFFELALEG